MRRYMVIALMALTPFMAWADPVSLSGGSLIAFPIVVLFALVVETGIVALLLTFSGLSPLRTFIGYFATNLAVYVLLFSPLVWWGRFPILIAELFVVVADGACIKLLASFEGFQGDDYQGVSWLRAALISCVGNVTSFLIGMTVSRSL